MSAELTFDAAEPGDNKQQAKFEFASINQIERDSKLNHHNNNEEEDSGGESIRSTQISQLSAKPLHSY